MSNNSERRPRVSIVHTAGKAPAKLTKPKMQEANKELKVEKPAFKKICMRKRVDLAGLAVGISWRRGVFQGASTTLVILSCSPRIM